MKIFQIAAFEFRYMVGSLQTLLVFVALFGFAVLFTADGAEFQVTARGSNVLINAPTMITFFLLMTSVVAAFFVPSYMATSVLKDVDSCFDAILFSTPISKNHYLFGRFFGAFGALMLVLFAGPVGMFLGTFWPWAVPETLGPTNLLHYLVSYFGFFMPTMLLVSALIFAVAVMSRSMIYCYVAVLGLFILYVAGQVSNIISPLWDPFMLRTFDDHIQYWTAAELNENLISYSGSVLANRLIWLAVAVGLFFAAYLRFLFHTEAKLPKGNKNKTKKNQANAGLEISVNTSFRGKPNWAGHTHFQQLWTSTKFEVLAVLKSQPFILLMGFSLFLLVMSLSDRTVLYNVNALPVTRILMSGLSEALVWALMAVTIFYGADVVWRDRESKFSDLIDALPAPNWVFVLSKITALIAVIYSILALGAVVAVSIQVLNGYYNFEFDVYLERMFLFSTTFIFLAVLSCFFQVLVKSRFLGIMLMGLFIVATLGSMGVLGFEHPLLRYALGTVASPMSDMNGAGRFIEADIWIRAYYGSVAGLLVMFTYVLWNRGTLQPLKYRLKKLKAFQTGKFLAPFAVLLVLFVGSGAFVFYNTNILNEYRTSADSTAMQVAYEQRFRQYENLPMPRTVDINVQVDIFPYAGRIEARGRHVLENKTNTDISSVHLVFPQRLASVPHVALEGAALKSVDEVYNYYIFELDSAMEPGEQRTLDYETLVQNQGFPHRRPDVMLVRNGTYFDNRRIAPRIGFNSELLLEDRDKRREAGLPALARAAQLEDTSMYRTNAIRGDSDFINFEATVSTVADQIAVAPGYLQKEWMEGGRRYFTYKMDAPIIDLYSFLSAEYEVLRDEWNDVKIEIFHHKPHSYNVARMMESTKDSLAYFSKHFRPYQFKQSRILEFPAYRKLARSYPNTIAYSENLGFLADMSDASAIDVPYYVTSHEIAHQWWGHQITPANTQGAAMLTEALSQYSALMVMEKKYGKDQIRKFLKFELDSYLSERDNDAEGEVPLLRAEGQEYIHYRKGAVIMYALKDYLGEDTVNHALQQFIEQHAFKSTPYPTALDLLAYLKGGAGSEYHGLIEDFLQKITLYDVKLMDASVEALPNERFKVLLTIEALKFYSDAVGNQRQAIFDIPVDIGLFTKSPDARGFSSGDVVQLGKHRIVNGRSTLEVIVDKKPTVAGIDPYNKLIDRDSEDNLGKIEMVSSVEIAVTE